MRAPGCLRGLLPLALAITLSAQSTEKRPPRPPKHKVATETSPVEIAYWNFIQDSTNSKDFEAYLKKFPKGVFADLARNRIEMLTAPTVPKPPPIPPPPMPKPVPTNVGSYPGQAWADPVSGITFCWIPAGSFDMGSDSGASDEKPIHHVTLTNGFWMGKTEVTQAQWQAFMQTNPASFKGAGNPVEMVSWGETRDFLKRLNVSGRGLEYRLPTEAEWEYACRAGMTGDRYGDLDAIAWYGGNSGSSTHPVGQKQANAWGLQDMLGNVMEWCGDWKGAYEQRSLTDPTGPSSGSANVYRGGSWNGETPFVRSARRFAYSSSVRSPYQGFRVAAVVRTASEPMSSLPDTTLPIVSVPVDPSLAVTFMDQHKPGEIKTVNLPGGAKLDLVFIPPGNFLMGSDNGLSEEKPLHAVTLTRGFWMSASEITQTQWRSITGDNPSHFQGDDKPVDMVSWNNCQDFLQQLNHTSNDMTFRLPTEAEWEYACRAGTTGDRYDSLPAVAWYASNTREETHPVRQKRPNTWGLYDMLGNVWEWCADSFGAYASGHQIDPVVGLATRDRVLRGGCFSSIADRLRTSGRVWDSPTSGSRGYGFRIVAVVKP